MAANNPPVPNITAPLVDQEGRVTPGWYQYLVWLGVMSASASVSGLVNVNDYLQTGDVDYDGAFARAFAASKSVYVPTTPLLGGTTYAITTPVIIEDGFSIEGDGLGLSIIEQQTTNVPVLELGQQIFGFSIRKLSITHAGVAVAGGDGLKQNGGALDWVNGGIISEVGAEDNYVGFALGKAFYCQVERCNASNNLSNGWAFTTDGDTTVPSGAAAGPMQWYLSQCSAGVNGLDGFSWTTVGAGYLGGPSSIGTMTACTTYKNARHGAAFFGNAAQGIESVRIEGGFFGEDLGDGIHLNTYARLHVIRPAYVELAGGAGIEVTPNNTAVVIEVGVVNGCGSDGAFMAATECQVIGGIFSNNGLNPFAAGRHNGLYFFGVTGMATGVRCVDTGAGTQLFGITGNVDGNQLTGCDLRGNVTAPIALPAPVTAQITGCFPVLINEIFTDQLHAYGATAFVGGSTGLTASTGIFVTGGGLNFTTLVAGNGIVVDNIHVRYSLGAGLAPTGTAGDISFAGSLFSSVAVGGPLGAGTINVSGSVNLNGVAYVNP